MDTNDYIKLLDKNKQQLDQILEECKGGSPELVLLSSEMAPLLEDFTEHKNALLSFITSQNTSDASTEDLPQP